MAKIGQPPRAPMWPWGGPRSVRDKLVDRSQLERKGTRKKGDARNPALASAALLDFIGPPHSADELRLPLPVPPGGQDAELERLLDRPHLSSVAERLDEGQQQALERGFETLRAPRDRVDRLRSLLQREASMLELISGVAADQAEVERRRKEETQESF